MTPSAGSQAFWSALVTGASGISQIERFPVGDLRGGATAIEALADQGVGPRAGLPRHAALVSAASELAHRADSLEAPERLAVVVGTALGGAREGGARWPVTRAACDNSTMRPPHLARWLTGGPVITVSTACLGATAWRSAPISSGRTRRMRWWRAGTTSSVAS